MLAANSEYFRKLFIDDRMLSIAVCVPYIDMMSILELMYRGEVRVRQEQLDSFLTSAHLLKVDVLDGNPSLNLAN